MTGIASTSLARLCSNVTITGAWSSAVPRENRLIVTLIVAFVLVDELSVDEELSFVATFPTSVIRPWTVFPDGSSTLTRAPTLASVDFVVSRSTVTTFRVEVVVRTVFAGDDAAAELAPLPPPPPPPPPPALAAPADGAAAPEPRSAPVCCGAVPCRSWTAAGPCRRRGPGPVLGVPEVVGVPEGVGVPELVDGVVVVACAACAGASPV